MLPTNACNTASCGKDMYLLCWLWFVSKMVDEKGMAVKSALSIPLFHRNNCFQSQMINTKCPGWSTDFADAQNPSASPVVIEYCHCVRIIWNNSGLSMLIRSWFLRGMMGWTVTHDLEPIAIESSILNHFLSCRAFSVLEVSDGFSSVVFASLL